jgi:hypothetical protein
MPHLDFVALREPVTCTLPTDEPGRKRLVRQFRRYELEQFEQAEGLRLAGDIEGAIAIYNALCRFAIEGVTDAELSRLSTEDQVRLLGAAHGKLDLIEAALGNARGGGDSSTTTANPPPTIPDSKPTTDAPPLQAG